MFNKFVSHASVFKRTISAAILIALIVAIGDSAYAAKPTPWKFNYTKQDNVTLSYRGVPVIMKSTLQVTTPDWKNIFYSTYNDNDSTKVQKQADGSWHITGKNEYVSAEYDLRPLDAQDFEMHFRCELLKDVTAHIEYNAGYFNGDLFYNRPFTAQIGATKDSPAHDISGIVPAYPATEGLIDLAPGFQTLNIDSRIGKMSIKILSASPVVFADARRHSNGVNGPIFWCGWLAGMQPLTVGQPVEMTMTIHVDPPAPEAPQVVSINPVNTNVPDAFVPAEQPVQVIPKPKKMQIDAGQHFVLGDTTQWSATAPAGETRLTAAVQNLLSDRWNVKLPAPHIDKGTFKAWCGIRLGDDKPISFPADLADAEWATHPGAYQLAVDKDGIQIIAPTAQGVFYGVQTLAQLLRSDGKAVNVPFAQIEDWPTLQFRGALFHPAQSDVPFMKQLIGIMARNKYNYAVIDCTLVHWKSHPKIVWPDGISEKDLSDLVNLCRANFIEPIPLIEGPGHANWLIRNGQNLDLAEDPQDPEDYSVNNPKSLELVHEFMSTLIDIFHPKYFHIGGDEANRGRFPNPDNPFNSKEDTASSLMLKNIDEQHDWLAKRGIKTMMWGDMFLDHQEGVYAANAVSVEAAQQARAALPKDIIVTDWQYNESDTYPSLNLFQKEGLTTVATPWYSPLDIRNFTQTAIENSAWGTLQSTWYTASRNASALVRHPEDFSAYYLGADYSWSGRSELPDALPYSPATLLRRALMPQIHTQHSGDLLDLKPAANVAADSWLGLGEGWNLASFFAGQNGTANRRFDGIDFRIPDGKFVVMSLDSTVMSPAGALQGLTLNVNDKATEIAFLHSTLWEVPNATIAARCTVQYADGTQSEINFMTGENIASWQGDSEVSLAETAWKGTLPSGQKTALRVFRWVNPYPEKVITRMSFQPVDAQAGYVLAGITLIQ